VTIAEQETLTAIEKNGLIPGAQAAPGQPFKAAHSSYATYFHASLDAAEANVRQAGGDKVLGNYAVIVEARIPITPKSLIRLLPDEDVSPNRKDGVKALLETSAVAYIGGVPPSAIRIYRPSKKTYAAPAAFRPRNAAKWMREKEFYVTDLLDSQITESVRGVLVNGLKTGELNAVVADKIWTAFEPYLGDPNILRDGEPLSPARLEAIVRTNLTDAYNHGRMMEYTSDDMLPFLNAIRYSAILDERTTPVCSFLDGKLFDPIDPDLTDLLPPNHFNCFISPRTKVFTACGWRDIGRLKIGDEVLTHKGRFRPVTFVHHLQAPTKYSGAVTKIKLAPQFGPRTLLVCTPGHPVLTTGGWKLARSVTREDQLLVMAKKCVGCERLLPSVAGNGEGVKYCGVSCQMKYEYDTGLRDPFQITVAANLVTRRMVEQGVHPLQRVEVRKKGERARLRSAKFRYAITDGRRGDLNPMRIHPEIGRSNGLRLVARWRKNPELHPNRSMSNVSMPQRRLHELALKVFGQAELEHPVRTGGSVRYIDVALPQHRIALEYEGSHWHKDEEKDLTRIEQLSEQGWRVLRYRDRVPLSDELRQDVERILSNHRKEYLFMTCAVASVKQQALRRVVKLYNLSVKDDESYIVGCGVVVHNCRSIVVPVVVGEVVDEADFITPEDVGHAKELADAKFLAYNPDQPRNVTVFHPYIIEQRGSVWVLLTRDRSRVLGTHDTREEAEAQERAVEANKATKGGG
ncbi:MAG: phage minor head protein, partial [Candidatus Binatia bacterium]|nr:phage minor head protein [Candidatus Binatia bacterium]